MSDSSESKERLLERMRRDLGSFVMQALGDPKVTEIIRNADGSIRLDVAGVGLIDSEHTLSANQAASFLGVAARLLDTTLTKESPILEGELPLDGSRLEGVVPPITPTPIFAIRKKATQVFSLANYAERGMIRAEEVEALKKAVKDRANILIVGSTGSGKTTLANAMLGAVAEVSPNDRVIAIENVSELQIPVADHVVLRSNDDTSMERLLKATMRLRPDRIVVGEVRGAEAYTLLKAWNSGHPGGMATIHADSAELGLHKLTDYVYEAAEAAAFPEHRMGRSIAAAIQVVLFITKIGHAPGRMVSEIRRVRGFTNGSFDLEPLCL